MFTPTTRVLDKSNFCYAIATRQNVGANKGSRKCAGKSILSKDLVRAAELQVGLTGCRVLWDEIRRGNNRCSVPRENHLQALRKR